MDQTVPSVVATMRYSSHDRSPTPTATDRNNREESSDVGPGLPESEAPSSGNAEPASSDNFDLRGSDRIEINLVTPIALSAGILSQVVLWVFQAESHLQKERNDVGAGKQKLYISDFGHGTTNESGDHFHRFSVSDAQDNNLVLLYRYIEGVGRNRWLRTVLKTGSGNRIGEFSKMDSRPYQFRIWPVHDSGIRTEKQMTYYTQHNPEGMSVFKNDERIFHNSCLPLLSYNKDTTKFMSFHWDVNLEREEKLVLLGLVADMALSYTQFNYCSTCRVIHMTLNNGPRNVTIRFGNDYTLKRIQSPGFMYGD